MIRTLGMMEDHLIQLLGIDECKRFILWAFGDSIQRIEDVPFHWNQRHKNLFEIFPEGDCVEDLKRMVESWKVA